MRVLMVHNRYRHEGGEERAVADSVELLRRRGHEVTVLERTSAAASRRTAARGMVGGGIEPDEVAGAVRTTGADVLHAHNVHPLFGWRSLAAARDAGARVVMHLHNFRLFCAIAIAYRDGEPCFRCRGIDTLPGLRLRCRGSLGEAAVYALGLHRQQPRLLAHVDRFLAVSEATRERLVGLGLPPARSHTLHNCVLAESIAGASRAAAGEFALVAGRLVEEKGFDTAIAACRAMGVPLVVAGDGPDEQRLRNIAVGAEVTFTGRLAPADLAGLRARAAVVLVPSRWEEPCPYSVLDALASGVPVLASALGGLPEIAGVEGTIGSRDAAGWARELARLWSDPDLRRARGEAGLTAARERFGEERFYAGLMAAYAGRDRVDQPC
jgi:glycosyltransferase involved in cell wall biosynthesis